MKEKPGSGHDGTPGVQSVGKTPRQRRFGVDSNPYGDVEKDTMDGKRGMDASSRHGRAHGDSGSRLVTVHGEDRVSELERELAVANPGLFGSVLSVAKTPIRVAAGLMTKVSALGGYFTSPRSSRQFQREEVDLVKDKEEKVEAGAGSDQQDPAIAGGEEGEGGKGRREHMVPPDHGGRGDTEQGRTVQMSPGSNQNPIGVVATEIEKPADETRALTPYDNVLELLKGGKTPIQFPTPRSRQRQDANILPRRALQSSFLSPSPSKGALGGSTDLGGSRLGSAFRMQGIGTDADDKGKVEATETDKTLGTFTFEATRAAMVKEARGMTPGSGIGSGMKPIFTGSAGPKRGRPFSASPGPAFAWTPMKSSSPASLSLIGEGSKKRKANGFGSTPSMDEGSVSLLDMQRRRRFKPSDVPGSTGRRSWRAGRTPYQSMMGSYSRLKPRSKSPQESFTDLLPTVPITEGISPQRPTSDTARRILATLDSMEETAKKSKKSISPLEASRYTMSAKPSPPPGASLGSFVPKQKTGSLEEKQQEISKPFALSQARVSFTSPAMLADKSPSNKKRKSKRRASDDEHPGIVSAKLPHTELKTEKLSESVFKKVAPEVKASTVPGISDKKELDYQFGTSANDLRVKVAEATKSVDLGGLKQVSRDNYLFGEDKDKVDQMKKPAFDLSVAQDVSSISEREITKKAEVSIPEQKPFPVFSKPVSEPAPLLAASGWGSDFLKKNAETAAVAKEAIEKEVQKDAAPEVKPPKITYGLPSVVSEEREAKMQSSQEAVAPVCSGWGPDFLKKNAETAALAKEAIEKEVQKDAAPEVKLATTILGASAEEKKSSENQQMLKTFEIQRQDIGEMRPGISTPSPDLATIGSQPEMVKHQDDKEGKFPFSVPAQVGFGNATTSAGFSMGATGIGNKEEAKHDVFVFGAQDASTKPKIMSEVHSDTQKSGFDSQPGEVELPIKVPSASTSGATFGSNTPSFDFGAPASQSLKPFTFRATSSGPGTGFGGAGSMQQSQTGSAPSTGTMQFGAAPMNSLGTSGVSGSGISAGSSFSGFNGAPASGEPKFSFPPVTQGAPAFVVAQSSTGASAAGLGFTSQQQAPVGGFASGFGSSEQPVSSGLFGASNPSVTWNNSGPASFTPGFNQAPTNSGFGAQASGFGGFAAAPANAFNSQNTFGTQTTGGLGPGVGGFGASPFPQPSVPGQMIPNDNPFSTGLPSAGGFSLGSTGNSQSEGRRKVKVKRRNRH